MKPTPHPAARATGDGWPAVRLAGSARGLELSVAAGGDPHPPRPGLGRGAPVPAAPNFCDPPAKRAARGPCRVPLGKVQARPKGIRRRRKTTSYPSFPPASPLIHTHGEGGRGAGGPLPSFAGTALSHHHFVFARGLRRARALPRKPARPSSITCVNSCLTQASCYPRPVGEEGVRVAACNPSEARFPFCLSLVNPMGKKKPPQERGSWQSP